MMGDAEKKSKRRNPTIKFNRNKLRRTKIDGEYQHKEGRLWKSYLENADRSEIDRQVVFLKRANKKEHDDYIIVRNGNKYDLLKRR